MSQATIIIGFAEALSAPEVAWSLVDAGFAVTAFTRKGRRPSLRHSRFVEVFEITPPEENFEQTIEDLKKALVRIKGSSGGKLAVMPLDDASVWLCSKIDFGDQTVLVGPRGQAVDFALDKRKQIELARTAGFAVPKAQWFEPGQSAPKKSPKFPVVFKAALAAEASGTKLGRGRGWVCADQGELDSAFRQWADNGPMLLQEFVPGGVGEGLFGVVSDTGVSAWSGHRRVRMMNPQGSGSSACQAVTEIDGAAQAAGERFLAGAGWRGLFMIELLRDRSGKLWFIEFNGRAWGSMALARRGGLEYPAWAVRSALEPGFSIPLPKSRDRALLCRHLARETLYLMFVLRGSKSKALHDWPSIWKALFQVVRIGRNDCWYNWRRDDPRVFVSDWFGTLRDQLVRTKHS